MRYFIPHDSIDCGPVCLKMISDYYGQDYSLQFLRTLCNLNRLGVSIYNLATGAEKLGYKAVTAQLSLLYLKERSALPCVLFWDKNHFVVLYKITKSRGIFFFHIADPGQGKVKLNEETFKNYWLSGGAKGFALFLEPTKEFYFLGEKKEASSNVAKRSTFLFILQYFLRYKGNYLQVFFAMAVAAFTSFLFPFLTQSIVDYGIGLKDLNFVVLVLIFQLFLFVTSTTADVVRSHLLLHVSSRVSISLLGDFLYKMMRLPLHFFETKMPGDLIQRIQDHNVVEEFTTSTLLTSIFTFVNIIVYSSILCYYNITIFTVFIIASLLSIAWTLVFLKWRKALNYLRFQELSNTNDKLFEMATQMPEIKINQFEKYKQREWGNIRIKLFKIEISRLSLEQYQRIGSDFFDQIRTILILFISVYSVIQGELTLGMMLAISYIVGQLSSPVKELIRLINNFQTASISLERMNEVYTEKEEKGGLIGDASTPQNDLHAGIELKNVSFGYLGPDHDQALIQINIKIPRGKVTAIVGSSGSGKTTLLKLLLKFYQPQAGEIILDGNTLDSYSIEWWRSQCGVVMQDGHIFSDTIKRNIVMGDETNDNHRLIHAVQVANIEDFILDLPMHFDTKVGESGLGMSGGQKQRLLIARAVYKNPSFIFFDEATSSLDAKNEKVIMENLQAFFTGKTVVIIAHRLSTVKSADQILVLEKGKIAEVGNHTDLIQANGVYYNLVKNQLELGQ